MKVSSTNQSNIFIRECLTTALINMMQEKKISDISIVELTEYAGVSRMAYYRNYTSKEEILSDYIDELFDKYKDILLSNDLIDIESISYNFFSFFSKHVDLIRALIKSNMKFLLLDRYDEYMTTLFKDTVPKKNGRHEMDIYEIYYRSGGIFRVIIGWVENDCDVPMEQMVELVSRLAYFEPAD